MRCIAPKTLLTLDQINPIIVYEFYYDSDSTP